MKHDMKKLSAPKMPVPKGSKPAKGRLQSQYGAKSNAVTLK